MLIIGAKGFAKEVLEIFHQNNEVNDIAFYDDVSNDLPSKLYDQFPIITNEEEAVKFFQETDNRFTIGIGNPVLRKKIATKFKVIGGILTSTISVNASIGTFGVEIGEGCNILSGSIFSNSTKIGIGGIIYYNAIITHHCIINDFVEISPGVIVLGRVTVGSYSQLGANCTILPNIKIGKNVIIGAGSVVTKDIPDNCIALGIPAKVIKELPPLEF